MIAIGSTDGICARVCKPNTRKHKHDPPATLRQVSQVEEIGTDPTDIHQCPKCGYKIKRGLISAALISDKMIGHCCKNACCKNRHGILGKEHACNKDQSHTTNHDIHLRLKFKSAIQMHILPCRPDQKYAHEQKIKYAAK